MIENLKKKLKKITKLISLEQNIRILYNETSFYIKRKYLGSFLGKTWLLLNPLIMSILYTFLMSYIFKIRINDNSSDLDYTIYLLAGMATWISIQESITESTTSIISNANLVKNVVFPLEILPLSAMLSGSISMFISYGILIIIMFINHQYPSWTILLFPFVVFLQYFFLSGISFLLSALNVFIRDIQSFLPPVLTILMFVSPVFYVESMVPEQLKTIFKINPVYHILTFYRNIVINGRLPNWKGLIFLIVVGFVFLYLGIFVFKRLKPYFEERL